MAAQSNLSDCSVIAATLREHDYQVDEAPDGAAAIERLMSGAAIDLVICDIAMPGRINGVDVAREAKRLRQNVKVLLISGDPSAVMETAVGAPEFPRLSKPFRQGDLIQAVERHPLPGWAVEINAANWAQVLLKFIIAHPDITCVIPATTRTEHLAENMGAGTGPLPDAGLRRRMIADIEAL